MTDDNFTDLIRLGEQLREKGAFKEALDAFENACRIAASGEDFALVAMHQGLTFEKMGLLDAAQSMYELVPEIKDISADRYNEFLRHMARLNGKRAKQLQQNALEKAMSTVLFAVKNQRADTCWFIHGYLALAYEARAPWRVLAVWAVIETFYFFTRGIHDKNKTAKKVWVRNLLHDWWIAVIRPSVPVILLLSIVLYVLIV